MRKRGRERMKERERETKVTKHLAAGDAAKVYKKRGRKEGDMSWATVLQWVYI
jgi:hypothetical protein